MHCTLLWQPFTSFEKQWISGEFKSYSEADSTEQTLHQQLMNRYYLSFIHHHKLFSLLNIHSWVTKSKGWIVVISIASWRWRALRGGSHGWALTSTSSINLQTEMFRSLILMFTLTGLSVLTLSPVGQMRNRLMGPFWSPKNTNPQWEGNTGQLRGIDPSPDDQRWRFVIKPSLISASQNLNYAVISQTHESWPLFLSTEFENNIRGNRLKGTFHLALIEVASFPLLLHTCRLMCGATANHPVQLNHSQGLTEALISSQ